MEKQKARGTPPEQVGSFGMRLRQLREAAALSQEELAEKAGLSPAAISVLERGERKRPYPNTVRSLADALKLSEDERASLLAAVPRRAAPQLSAPSFIPGFTLPSPPTPLLGREQELREISDLLGGSSARLLTLTGIGGVGKTRLAVAAAREAEVHFPDGAAFVALAPLRDSELVMFTIARTLSLRETEGQTVGDSLRSYLHGRKMLLVLDNFEHLLGAAPEVIDLLESCSGPAILATSRAPLRVRGEQEYPVAPLTLPSTTRNLTEKEVLATPSGQLFLERGCAASPSFRVTAENAEAVAAICWRLAGLPLALELAAAKVKLLEPSALLSRLDQALSTAWARDLPERQRTMRATLDWSYELLSESQQQLFRCLSVFTGGFSLEAVEAVGVTNEAEDVLDLLSALVEQSLVQVQPRKAGGEMRYEMLELVRQYSLEKLEQRGEASQVQQSTAEFFLAFAETAASELWGPQQGPWLENLDRENGNLRTGILWALEAEKAVIAGRFCWALYLFWWARGYHLEGRRWAETALGLELPPTWRARVLPVAASMAFAQNDHDTAEEHWREGLSISLREGDAFAEGYARAGVGLSRLVRGDYEVAAARIGEALMLLKRYEDPLVSLVHVWLGTTSLARGDTAQAEWEIEEGLASARTRGDTICTYVALYNLAQVALARDDLTLAARTLKEGIQLSEQTKDRANLAHFLNALAVVASSRGEAERAAILLGAGEHLLLEVGAPVYNFYNPDHALRERCAADTRAVLGEAAFLEAWDRGWEMTFEQAVAYELS